MKTLVAALAASLVLAAIPAQADKHQPTTGADAFRTIPAVTYLNKQPSNSWLVSDLLGAEVKSISGETLGDINNLLVDERHSLSTVVIGVGGLLGIGEKNVAVPINALKINPASDGRRVVILDASKEELEKAPAFEASEPTLSDKALDLISKGQAQLESAAEAVRESAEGLTRSEEKKPADQQPGKKQ